VSELYPSIFERKEPETEVRRNPEELKRTAKAS
jgi:hypothetical protein